MRGKLVEQIKTQQIFKPTSITATTVLFNGGTATNGVAIDTQGFDDLVVVLNTGTFASAATVDFALYEAATDNTDVATAITGADFTQVTSANDDARQSIAIACKNQKRYIWLRSSKTGSGDAALVAATAILGKADAAPTAESPVADIDGSGN